MQIAMPKPFLNWTMRKIGLRTMRGFTLVELIIATAILAILTGLAIPLAKVTIKREREHELRHALWEIRDGIDRYKDAADRGAFQLKVGSEGRRVGKECRSRWSPYH